MNEYGCIPINFIYGPWNLNFILFSWVIKYHFSFEFFATIKICINPSWLAGYVKIGSGAQFAHSTTDIKEVPTHFLGKTKFSPLSPWKPVGAALKNCGDLWRFLGKMSLCLGFSKQAFAMFGGSRRRKSFLGSKAHRSSVEDSWAQPSCDFSDLMGRWEGHTGKKKARSSCNLSEIISVEKGVTCRRAGDGLETNDWFIQKVTTRTDLQNI